MSRPVAKSCSALEYRDAGSRPATLRLVPPAEDADEEPALLSASAGVPPDEVEQQVRTARETAVAETEQKLRAEVEDEQKRMRFQVAQALSAFAEERARYFNRVESEIVHLSLAIARKILQREAVLDPALLAALVRIALDGMQCESPVRLRVVPAEAHKWERIGGDKAGASQWVVVGDDALQPGDCFVETELGRANFGFEAQLRDVEESFLHLLAHKPRDL